MTTRSYHSLEAEIPPAPSGCPMDTNFSPFSSAYVADPYAELASRREETPVFYSEQLDMLVVTRMEDVAQVFMDPETFSSENVQDPVFPLTDDTIDTLASRVFEQECIAYPEAIRMILSGQWQLIGRRVTMNGLKPNG